MTKKELEELNDKLDSELSAEHEYVQYVDNVVNITKDRIKQNIDLIESNIKQEKNKDKKKLLGGLQEEFQYIYNLLDLDM